jgi:hypothetical protein
MNIEFLRHAITHSSTHRTAQLVECYRNVFADKPWNEWVRCSICGKYWGLEDYEHLLSINFVHCELPVVDFWHRSTVISDLRHEITGDASCWLAVDGDNVIGFTWGYPILLPEIEKKLMIPFGPEAIRDLSPDALVAYQDEVGVIASHRNKKIAKGLVLRRHRDFLAQGLTFGIVRTREYPIPSETFLWYTQKLDYQILARYPDGDGRIVLGRSFIGLEEMLT